MAISPKEVLDKQVGIELEKAKAIPKFVYDVFDNLIANNYNSYRKLSSVSQKDVVAMLREQYPDSFSWTWMDVEPLYRNLGWVVEYHKAPYYVTGESYYVFSIPQEK